MFFGPLWLVLLIPALLLAFHLQRRVRRTLTKLWGTQNACGMTGARVARQLLNSNGLTDVALEETLGELIDHYDPRARRIQLSSRVAHGQSIAALGIAAHEVGHAIQHCQDYAPLHLRRVLAAPLSFTSNRGPLILIAGVFVQLGELAWLGVAFCSLAVVFTLLTLRVEYDASQRGMRLLETHGLVTLVEYDAARQLLNAAALTYLASPFLGTVRLLREVIVVEE